MFLASLVSLPAGSIGASPSRARHANCSVRPRKSPMRTIPKMLSSGFANCSQVASPPRRQCKSPRANVDSPPSSCAAPESHLVSGLAKVQARVRPRLGTGHSQTTPRCPKTPNMPKTPRLRTRSTWASWLPLRRNRAPRASKSRGHARSASCLRPPDCADALI